MILILCPGGNLSLKVTGEGLKSCFFLHGHNVHIDWLCVKVLLICATGL